MERFSLNWNIGRCSKCLHCRPFPRFLIGIINFPNRNFDNFSLRPPRSLPLWDFHLHSMAWVTQGF